MGRAIASPDKGQAKGPAEKGAPEAQTGWRRAANFGFIDFGLGPASPGAIGKDLFQSFSPMPKNAFQNIEHGDPVSRPGKNKSFKGVNPIQPAAQKTCRDGFCGRGSDKNHAGNRQWPLMRGHPDWRGPVCSWGRGCRQRQDLRPLALFAPLLGKFDAAGEAAMTAAS